jgi:hypothetical protein
MLLHGKEGYVNVRQCYVIRTVHCLSNVNSYEAIERSCIQNVMWQMHVVYMVF